MKIEIDIEDDVIDNFKQAISDHVIDRAMTVEQREQRLNEAVKTLVTYASVREVVQVIKTHNQLSEHV